MNKIKKLVLFLAFIMLSTMFPSFVMAADAKAGDNVVNIESAYLADNKIKFVINSNKPEFIKKNNTYISVNDKKLNIEKLSNITEAPVNTTYLLMADSSKSISNDQLESIKDMMNQIVGRMGKGDNAAIGYIGKEITFSKISQDKNYLKKAMNQLNNKETGTTLYSSIVKSIDYLNTSNLINPRKVAIVFSDGIDDNIGGMTLAEALKKFDDTNNIPVYTITMTARLDTETELEKSKNFASFARVSSGGKNYSYKSGKTTDIVNKFFDDFNKAVVIEANKSAINFASNNYEVDVNVSNEKGVNLTDTYKTKIFNSFDGTKGFDFTMPDLTLPIKDDGFISGLLANKWFVILSILVIIAIMAIIIILCFSGKIYPSKRRKAQQMAENQFDDMNNNFYDDYQMTQPIMKQRANIECVLTPVGNTKTDVIVYSIYETATIGRNNSAEIVINTDSLISSKHCIFKWSNDALFIEDLGSTNGTFVNGVPIVGNYKLEQEDNIRIGSTELKVTWKVLK